MKEMMNNVTEGYQRIRQTSLNFVDAMKIGDKPGVYRKEAGERESFYGSYHAAHILDIFGELDKFSAEDKAIWAENFINRQTRQGYFSSKPEEASQRLDIQQMEPYWHYTRGNIWALRILGLKPQYPLDFLEPLLSADKLYQWVKKYNWSNSWAAGNQV